MKTTTGKKHKGADTDKAIARAGVESPKENKSKNPGKIILDSVIAEKDEVKIAEERLRQKTNKSK